MLILGKGKWILALDMLVSILFLVAGVTKYAETNDPSDLVLLGGIVVGLQRFYNDADRYIVV